MRWRVEGLRGFQGSVGDLGGVSTQIFKLQAAAVVVVAWSALCVCVGARLRGGFSSQKGGCVVVSQWRAMSRQRPHATRNWRSEKSGTMTARKALLHASVGSGAMRQSVVCTRRANTKILEGQRAAPRRG
jgi:hypothetical protein